MAFGRRARNEWRKLDRKSRNDAAPAVGTLSDDLAAASGLQVESPLRRPQQQEWSQDAPSWLISATLHFLILVLVTLSSPPLVGLSGGFQGHSEVSLTLGFAEAKDDAAKAIELVTPETESAQDTEAPAGTADDEAAQAASPPQDPAMPESQPPTDQQATDQPATADASAPDAAQASSGFQVSFSDTGKLSAYATIMNSRRVYKSRSTAAVAYAPSSVQPLTEIPVDPRQQRYDQIVDDFIDYDVGKLRGAAGQQARRRFSQLEEDAIPALVRGLNKSANIHATCPVGVIASKLLLTLQRSRDPTLRQYAIENVGRGVSENAPHFSRLMALRDRWLGKRKLPRSVETYVERVESRSQGELMELMLALSKSTSDTIIASIDSGDDFLAAAATLSVIQGRPDWGPEQKRRVRSAVTRLELATEREQLRQLAREAKRTLRSN